MNYSYWLELAINILLGLLSVYIIFEYYRTFFNTRPERTKIKIYIFICMVWQIISVPSISNIPALLRLFLSITFVALLGCCFVGSIKEKIVFAVIYIAIWMLSELLVTSFILNAKVAIEEYSTFGSFLCEILLLTLVKVLQKFFRHDSLNSFSWRHNAVLMLIPIGCMFFSRHLFWVSAKSGKSIDIWVSIIAFILLLAVVSVMFVMYIKLIDSYEIKRKNDIYSRELEFYVEHMKEKEIAMAEFRKSQHDFNHILVYLSQLLREKKYEELENYISERIDYKPLDRFMIADTDNAFIDAQINFKYGEAKRHGIDFRIDLDIPQNLPFDYGDLCVILGNALDNAIEANLKEKIEKPYISLKMKYKEGNLIIILENSFNGSIKRNSEGEILTLKDDKNNHGFGLHSIRNAVLRNHGDINIDVSDCIFKLSIIIYKTS